MAMLATVIAILTVVAIIAGEPAMIGLLAIGLILRLPAPKPLSWIDNLSYSRLNASDDEPSTTTESKINFSVYYPLTIRNGDERIVLAYVHVPTAAAKVEEDKLRRLGSREGAYESSSSAATTGVARPVIITAVPDVPNLEFDPPFIALSTQFDWNASEFRLRCAAEEFRRDPHWGEVLKGAVRFYVGSLLVAEAALGIRVVGSLGPPDPSLGRTICTPYQAVFVSYSHQDTEIVNDLEAAYQALGIEYLRDVRELRSGENWSNAIDRMIRRADIFQLCWSPAAKGSSQVEREWRYALYLKRSYFIRPVYWQKPLPNPPEELAHIHFAYLNWMAKRTMGRSTP